MPSGIRSSRCIRRPGPASSNWPGRYIRWPFTGDDRAYRTTGRSRVDAEDGGPGVTLGTIAVRTRGDTGSLRARLPQPPWCPILWVMRTIALVALLAAVPLMGQSAIPHYEVKRASSPPTIDGRLDEPVWAQASPALTLQFLWDSQTGAKQKTAARLLWDDQALYVGFDADDTDITARFLQRDDPTYRDDAVEIFINPDPKQETVYYGFEMNARGTLYDYLNYNSRTLFKRFDATGVAIATAIRGTLNDPTDVDSGWSLEASIPWANFEELSR